MKSIVVRAVSAFLISAPVLCLAVEFHSFGYLNIPNSISGDGSTIVFDPEINPSNGAVVTPSKTWSVSGGLHSLGQNIIAYGATINGFISLYLIHFDDPL